MAGSSVVLTGRGVIFKGVTVFLYKTEAGVVAGTYGLWYNCTWLSSSWTY